MRTPTVIKHGKLPLAIVFRVSMQIPEGVHFYTSENNPFQVGIHKRKQGTKLPPHIHTTEQPITVNVVQELLTVVSGKIRVLLYSEKGKLCKKIVLSTGDSILLMHGGHGVEFLSDAKVFELKQGPYRGPSHAKIYL